MLPLVTLDPSIITTETAKAVVNEPKRKRKKKRRRKKTEMAIGPLENDGRS